MSELPDRCDRVSAAIERALVGLEQLPDHARPVIDARAKAEAFRAIVETLRAGLKGREPVRPHTWARVVGALPAPDLVLRALDEVRACDGLEPARAAARQIARDMHQLPTRLLEGAVADDAARRAGEAVHRVAPWAGSLDPELHGKLHTATVWVWMAWCGVRRDADASRKVLPEVAGALSGFGPARADVMSTHEELVGLANLLGASIALAGAARSRTAATWATVRGSVRVVGAGGLAPNGGEPRVLEAQLGPGGPEAAIEQLADSAYASTLLHLRLDARTLDDATALTRLLERLGLLERTLISATKLTSLDDIRKCAPRLGLALRVPASPRWAASSWLARARVPSRSVVTAFEGGSIDAIVCDEPARAPGIAAAVRNVGGRLFVRGETVWDATHAAAPSRARAT